MVLMPCPHASGPAGVRTTLHFAGLQNGWVVRVLLRDSQIVTTRSIYLYRGCKDLMAKSSGKDIVATNRQAAYRYFIGEALEAGLILEGPEVKSLRDRRVSLKESFCRVFRNEAWILNLHITPWLHAGRELDPTRTRKLLLKKSQVKRLMELSGQKGFALIPLKLYFNKRGIAKVEIALCQGKRQYDKRESIKRKLHDREMERAQKLKRG